jgi:hypothetical protein
VTTQVRPNSLSLIIDLSGRQPSLFSDDAGAGRTDVRSAPAAPLWCA